MSHTDKHFQYISSRNDCRTLSASRETVAVADRARPTSGPGGKMAAPVRRSSSVTSSRRRQSSSRDVGVATLRWSKRWYSVQELAQEFGRQFPVIVRVMQVHSCGDDVSSLKLIVGQVLHILGVCGVEKRLRATNSDEQTISIPLDSDISVQHVLSSDVDDVMSLSSAVNQAAQLPFTVRCIVQSRDQASRSLHEHLLTISQLYDSAVLLANPIHNDWLDVATSILICDDLSVQLSVAEGLAGATDDEWLDYCGMFARAARPINASHYTSHKGCYRMNVSKSTGNVDEPTSSSSSSSAAAAAAARDVDDNSLDVQPYIISPHDVRRSFVDGDVQFGPQLSVVTRSERRLNVVSDDLRPSLVCFDMPYSVNGRRSSLPTADDQRPSRRRRRRADVEETSFVESAEPCRREAVPPLPRMGKLAMPRPISQHKSTTIDIILSSESGLGSSMPCLAPTDERDPEQSEVRDVLVPSALSTLSSTSRGTGRTSLSVYSGLKTRSCHYLQVDDEGYLTKESNTSTSSVDTSRHSPVYF